MTTNEHYQQWLQNPSQGALDGLLGAVQRQAYRQAAIKLSEHAEDIAQDATIAVWQTISKYDPTRSSFSTWVWQVTNGIILDRFRQQRNSATSPVEPFAETAVEQPSFTNYERLHDAFSNDPQLLLLLINGHTLADCQRLLSITRKALRCRIEKIRKAAQQGPFCLSQAE